MLINHHHFIINLFLIIIFNLKNLKTSFGVADELLDVVVLLEHVRAELLVLVVQPFHLIRIDDIGDDYETRSISVGCCATTLLMTVLS